MGGKNTHQRGRTIFLIVFGAVVVLATVFFVAQQAVSTPGRLPKIDSVSPEQGPVGGSVTLTGSGFTGTGNGIQARGKTIATELASSDGGTTLTVRFPADSPCAPEQGTCPLKVVNARGMSNAIPFRVTAGAPLPLTYNILLGVAPDSPPSQEIPVGSVDVEVAKFLVTSDPANPGPFNLEGVILTTAPDPGYSYACDNVSDLKLFLGTQQVGGPVPLLPRDAQPPCIAIFGNLGIPMQPGNRLVLTVKVSIPSTARVGDAFNFTHAYFPPTISEPGVYGFGDDPTGNGFTYSAPMTIVAAP